MLGQLTGQPSLNNTGSVNVYGTDLGSMFLHSDGRVYFLFGDTFGPPGPPKLSHAWRSNTMAYSGDTNAADGITFDGWMTDSRGHARALIEGQHRPNDGSGEVTKIPSHGWSYAGKMHVWYMSVRQWGSPGRWTVDYAGVATSVDHGYTWSTSRASWPGTSNFIQVAVVQQGDHLLIWGLPAGRFGGVKLACAPAAQVLNPRAYRYYAGDGRWSLSEEQAVVVVPPPVGEISVLWNPFLDRWLITYLNEGERRIEVREALEPWGPWSEPWMLASGGLYPSLYGAFMHPRFMKNDGETIYFLVSLYRRYNVFLMTASFERR